MNTMNDRFLRRHEMLAMVAVPQATVYLMMQRQEFPRSYRISRRLVGWRESEIKDWMATRPGYVHRPYPCRQAAGAKAA